MKILLVDDHALFRESVALLVEHRLPGLQLRLAGTVAAALDALHTEPGFALVLLDLTLPDSDGLSGLERLRGAWPQLPVVVMSADDRPETVLAAIDRGAAGFVPKSADSSAFASALRTVFEGRVYLPPHALLGRAPKIDGLADDELGLSPRQVEVLRLLVQGRSNKLIMRELSLSESTVKTHLEAIFRRLGVNSRTQAVVAAARMGLRLADPLA